MNIKKVLYADSSFGDLKELADALASVDVVLVHGGCKTKQELITAARDAVGIITESIPLDASVFKVCPALELIYTNNVGTELIDIAAATQYGIRACHNPDYNYREVAEHTLALLLSLIRKIPVSHAYVRAGGLLADFVVVTSPPLRTRPPPAAADRASPRAGASSCCRRRRSSRRAGCRSASSAGPPAS